ncbi:hypothetical protein F5146DRAFT_1133983 [Armillaria mellea]|nr:hypothetical protein F5146DRAFT_1133983 [Armillaria mellea]
MTSSITYQVSPFLSYHHYAIVYIFQKISETAAQSDSTYQPKSNNSYYESFGGYNNFMHSYGLKPWDMDDVEEGKAILQMFKEQGRLEHEEAQKNSGKK